MSSEYKRKRQADLSLKPPKKPREGSRPIGPLPAASDVPSIVVDQPESLNESEEPGGGRADNAEPFQLLATSPKSPPSSHESFKSDDSNFYPSNRSFYNSLSITCKLSVTFEEYGVEHLDHNFELSLHDPNSYQKIEVKGKETVSEAFTKDLDSRETSFRYGNCTILGDKGYRCRRPLRNSQDWEKICKSVISHGHRHLQIWREYFSYQTCASKESTLTAAKRDELHDLMLCVSRRNHNLEWPYVGDTDLDRIIPLHMVADIINEDSSLNMDGAAKDKFIGHVQAKARILLAMFVKAKLPMTCLHSLLEQQIADSSLPLSRTKTPRCHEGKRHRPCRQDFDDLVEKQCRFLPARFDKIGEHQNLDRDSIVPIYFSSEHDARTSVKEGAFCGSGTFSTVYRVRLDPNQHALSEDRDACFALKEFKHRPQKVPSDFEKELKILNELRRHHHDHIVTHLATWTRGEMYFMLFPYAQCNLREYMKKTCPDMNYKKKVLWLLKQISGLASALKLIHGLSDDDTTSSPTPQFLVPVPQREHVSGWHHDIKPENILFFLETDPPRELFRISDWGSGKVNTYRSGSIRTESASGTPTYEPPEIVLDGNTSRPHDVWSLGCVFLELLVWSLKGSQAVDMFKKERQGRRDPSKSFEDDGFWQKKENCLAIVRDSVVRYMQDLDETISMRKLMGLKPVLDLVGKMLNPERSARIKALEVDDTLDRIHRQTEIDFERPSAEKEDPSLPRLSVKAPDPQSPDHGFFNSPTQRHAIQFTDNLYASPSDMTSRHSHSRNTSDLAPSIASHRSRTISNASSTLSVREGRQGPANANAPEG